MIVNKTCCVRMLVRVSNIGLKLAVKGGGITEDWRKLRNEDICYVD